MAKEPEVTIVKLLTSLYTEGLQYIGYILIAVIGGFMNYLQRLKTGEVSTFKFISLLAELAISGFAGLLASLLASGLHLEGELIFFLAGISGHLGARAIFLMQAAVVDKAKSNITKK